MKFRHAAWGRFRPLRRARTGLPSHPYARSSDFTVAKRDTSREDGAVTIGTMGRIILRGGNGAKENTHASFAVAAAIFVDWHSITFEIEIRV